MILLGLTSPTTYRAVFALIVKRSWSSGIPGSPALSAGYTRLSLVPFLTNSQKLSIVSTLKAAF